MQRVGLVPAVVGIAVLLTVAGAGAQGPPRGDLLVAVTTSTQDSGIMDALVPLFERQSGYRVKTIAGGTGQTLRMGARGEADVVLGHAPELEKPYVAEGVFVERRLFMYNDFVLVGPPSDPLRVKSRRRLIEVFREIAETRTLFVSRGDQSGTHVRELALWNRAGVKPGGGWYVESGQGQGATLNIASERGAYALTDRGTFLAWRKRLNLDIVLEGSHALLNIYHVLLLNPARYPRVNHEGARAFGEFLLSPAAQEMIRTFGADRYGRPLFFPAAGKREENFQDIGG